MNEYIKKVVLVAVIGIIAAIGIYGYLAIQAKESRDGRQTATTTPKVNENIEETKEEEPIQEERKETTKPKTEVEVNKPTYTPPTPQPVQPVIINNTNIQNNPPAEKTTAPPVTTAAPEPRTPEEKAQVIVESYDPNGTAELLSNGKIRVRAFSGREVIIDVTGNWEENLKLTLNRIK